MRPLPAPDVLDVELPDDHVFLLVDDGSDLVPALVRRLRAIDWPVVVMRLPQALSPDATVETSTVFSDLPSVSLNDDADDAVVTALSHVHDSYGPVAGCAVLCASSAGTSDIDGVPEARRLDELANREGVRFAFELAKHLYDVLTEAAEQSWGGFFTITRVDGALGFSGEIECPSAVAGLTGLTKTLRLEWPTVACRAIDLAPDLEADEAADAVVSEILDPNRMVAEVGVQRHRRVTLTAPVHTTGSPVHITGAPAETAGEPDVKSQEMADGV